MVILCAAFILLCSWTTLGSTGSLLWTGGGFYFSVVHVSEVALLSCDLDTSNHITCDPSWRSGTVFYVMSFSLAKITVWNLLLVPTLALWSLVAHASTQETIRSQRLKNVQVWFISWACTAFCLSLERWKTFICCAFIKQSAASAIAPIAILSLSVKKMATLAWHCEINCLVRMLSCKASYVASGLTNFHPSDKVAPQPSSVMARRLSLFGLRLSEFFEIAFCGEAKFFKKFFLRHFIANLFSWWQVRRYRCVFKAIGMHRSWGELTGT